MKELNLVEILKDCPKGTKLYSTIYGEVVFEKVDHCDGVIYPICFYEGENLQCVTKNGLHLVEHDGECSLFPSKENREWSTFKVEKPKWNPDTLQPFDKVVGIRAGGDIWQGDMFLYRDETYAGLGGKEYDKRYPTMKRPNICSEQTKKHLNITICK